MMMTLMYVPAVLCTGVAAGLAASGKNGWGWFLFAAVVMCGIGASK